MLVCVLTVLTSWYTLMEEGFYYRSGMEDGDLAVKTTMNLLASLPTLICCHCEGSTLVVISPGIRLDDECCQEEDKAELSKRSSDRLHLHLSRLQPCSHGQGP